MEVRGPDGAWRADVMASDPGGAWRWALEAQLAPITASDITARTERMAADGVPSIWFSDRPCPPWLGAVPSVRLARHDDGQDLVIAEGVEKWNGSLWEAVPAPLAQFLRWAFTGRIIAHAPRWHGSGLIWTAPRYLRAWEEYLAEIERQSARPPRREWTPEQINAARNRARLEAARAESGARRSHTAGAASMREQAARRPEVMQAIDMLARKHGKTASVGWSIGETRYAGIPLVNADGWLVAILDPDLRRIGQKQFALHAGTLLLFTSKDRRIRFLQAIKEYDPKRLDGWKTDHC